MSAHTVYRRTAVQITTVVLHETDGGSTEWDALITTALCNDGTLWRHDGATNWYQMPAIPQDGEE